MGLLNKRWFSLRDSLFSLVGNLLLFLNEFSLGILGNFSLVVIELSCKLCLHSLNISLLFLLDLLLRFNFQAKSFLLFLHFIFEFRDLLALGEMLLGNGLLNEVSLLLKGEFLSLGLLFLLTLNLGLLLLEFELLDLFILLTETSLELILLFLLDLSLFLWLSHLLISLDLWLQLGLDLNLLFSCGFNFLLSGDLHLLPGFDLSLCLSLSLSLCL